MKIFGRQELRGGMTLQTRWWRWGWIHLERDSGLEIGNIVVVGYSPYVVTCIRYIRYHDGRMMIVISVMRFRWAETSLAAVALIAAFIASR